MWGRNHALTWSSHQQLATMGLHVAPRPFMPRLEMTLAPPQQRPAYRARPPHPPSSRRRRRRRRLAPLLVLVVVAAVFLTSLVAAARTPGNQAFKAKWADWLRSHHAGLLVNRMEAFYYGHQAPAKGGQPSALNKLPTGTSVLPGPKPTPVPLVVTPALAGEGQWQPIGPVLGGSAAMYVAQFRADRVYTSQITSAVWIDPTRLQVRLVPGSSEPGGTWSQSPFIGSTARTKTLAAFNGGFRFQDAHGGFYLDGRQAVPLRAGAASMVIYQDGRLDIGSWGRQVSMTPAVSAVLQNLVLLVDNGQVAPAATHYDSHVWGNTLGAKTIVARSGIGVTKSGALVYVAGPALSVRTLAEALQRAGAIRAMTLDINPEWVTFNFYQPSPTRLYPQMERPATRYLGPTRESRDFFTVSIPGERA
jgi:hypothetical protein